MPEWNSLSQFITVKIIAVKGYILAYLSGVIYDFFQ